MPRAIPKAGLGAGLEETCREDPFPLPPLEGVAPEELRAGDFVAGAEALVTGFTSTVAFAAAEVGVEINANKDVPVKTGRKQQTLSAVMRS